MLKKIFVPILILLFILLIPSAFYFFDYSQSIVAGQEKVVYNLPHPGLLPDHPLYFAKMIRDRIVEIGTRDHLKKAELYLLYSDKRMAMVMPLAKKGKDKLAITTLSKAEKYFLKIPRLLETSKKQGVSASDDFIHNLKVSNAKHKEMIEELLKELPQGQDEAIEEVMQINREVGDQLSKL